MHDPAHLAIADAIKGMTRTYDQAHPGTPNKRNLMAQLEKIGEKAWRDLPDDEEPETPRQHRPHCPRSRSPPRGFSLHHNSPGRTLCSSPEYPVG